MNEKISYAYKTEPYKHQMEAFEKLNNKMFGALFMEQGTGKSKTIIDIVSDLFIKGKINSVILIAPNTVHSQWAKEQIQEHSPIKTKVFAWSSKKTNRYKLELGRFINDKSNDLKWFCINVEAFSTKNSLKIFKKFLIKNECAIILDEATTIKNPNANRSFNITYQLGELLKRGNKVIRYKPYSKYRFILTGTMVTNNPYDLWSMMEFLFEDFFGMNYYAFKNKYGIERKENVANSNVSYNRLVSKKEIEAIKAMHKEGNDISYISSLFGTNESNIKFLVNNPEVNVPYKNLAELKKKILTCSYIVRKKDCLDLPPKVYEILPVELTKEQSKIYKNLEKDYMAEYQDKELSITSKLTLVLRLSQITGGFFPYDFTYYDKETDEIIPKKGIEVIGKNAKYEALKRDIGETDEQLVIFSRFTAEIEMLISKLKKDFPNKEIAGYYGKTSTIVRSKIKEDFKNKKIDILIGNPTCAGVGLNLQSSSLVYYFSNSHSLYSREQSEDRVHRIGQKRTVVYKDIIAKGTIDEKIYKVLKTKKSLLEYFRDHSLNEFIMTY